MNFFPTKCLGSILPELNNFKTPTKEVVFERSFDDTTQGLLSTQQLFTFFYSKFDFMRETSVEMPFLKVSFQFSAKNHKEYT